MGIECLLLRFTSNLYFRQTNIGSQTNHYTNPAYPCNEHASGDFDVREAFDDVHLYDCSAHVDFVLSVVGEDQLLVFVFVFELLVFEYLVVQQHGIEDATGIYDLIGHDIRAHDSLYHVHCAVFFQLGDLDGRSRCRTVDVASRRCEHWSCCRRRSCWHRWGLWARPCDRFLHGKLRI